jgi:hypothetical protein
MVTALDRAASLSMASAPFYETNPVADLASLPLQFNWENGVALQSESTYNWNADGENDWTIPVNVIVSKVTKLGTFPLSLGFGGGYYVESPEIGPDWKMRAVVTWILPGNK